LFRTSSGGDLVGVGDLLIVQEGAGELGGLVEAHALDEGGRALAEGEGLFGEEVDGVEAGDVVLGHVGGEREEHAVHALGDDGELIGGAPLAALVGPLLAGVGDVGAPGGRDGVEAAVDLLLHELHAVGGQGVGAADEVVDEEGLGAEELLAGVVDLGGAEAGAGVDPDGLEHHPAEQAVGGEARHVAHGDEVHAGLREEGLDELGLGLAGDGAVLGQLPQLVGEVGEEGVEDAAALVAGQAVEELAGGEAGGGGEDEGVGVAGADGGVEGVLDRELLGDGLEHEADREVGREVGEGALDRVDGGEDAGDLVGAEPGRELLGEPLADVEDVGREVEGDDRDAVAREHARELAELAEADVAAAAGDQEGTHRAGGIGLEDRGDRGVTVGHGRRA
jgi:hypothetical protein